MDDDKTLPEAFGIFKEEWERQVDFETDREIKIFKNNEWERGFMSDLKAGDNFRIYEITFSDFSAGADNEYVIKEYEVIEDAYVADNGAWEVECFLLEE